MQPLRFCFMRALLLKRRIPCTALSPLPPGPSACLRLRPPDSSLQASSPIAAAPPTAADARIGVGGHREADGRGDAAAGELRAVAAGAGLPALPVAAGADLVASGLLGCWAGVADAVAGRAGAGGAGGLPGAGAAMLAAANRVRGSLGSKCDYCGYWPCEQCAGRWQLCVVGQVACDAEDRADGDEPNRVAPRSSTTVRSLRARSYL
jgi:hypothetical protein